MPSKSVGAKKTKKGFFHLAKKVFYSWFPLLESDALPKAPQKTVVARKKRVAKIGIKGKKIPIKVDESVLPVKFLPPTASDTSPIKLERAPHNPILKPSERSHWESQATFNPAAIYAGGKVHLIYRAIGKDDVSVLGYAMSHNGHHIHERLAEPVFSAAKKEIDRSIPAADYGSGGGWSGGCEDPRLTLVDNIVYLLYTAFDGWGSIRIALSSISLEDFLNKKWNWEEPVIISPPGEIHKNWVIFPEKINGKYAILHSVSPNIRIDYFNDLNELRDKEKFIESKYVKAGRRQAWDSWVRGAGPPPIKTEKGWLLFYHAMDHNDPNRYKLGAMLLDLADPTKILYRSAGPVLEPDACYENEGFKAGVVYSCGAVAIDGKLFVYYGGADSVTCVATADLDSFLNELITTGAPKVRGVAKPKQKPYDNGKTLKKKSARLA